MCAWLGLGLGLSLGLGLVRVRASASLWARRADLAVSTQAATLAERPAARRGKAQPARSAARSALARPPPQEPRLRRTAGHACQTQREAVTAAPAAAGVAGSISPRVLPPVDGGGEPVVGARGRLPWLVYRCLLWRLLATASVLLLTSLLTSSSSSSVASAATPLAARKRRRQRAWRSGVSRCDPAPVATLGDARATSGHRAVAGSCMAPTGWGKRSCGGGSGRPWRRARAVLQKSAV